MLYQYEKEMDLGFVGYLFAYLGFEAVAPPKLVFYEQQKYCTDL